MPPKPQTLSPPTTTNTTNQQEYFLTLIEKLEFYEVIEQCEIDLKSHTMPPLSGDLTYAEAKTREEIMEAREKGYFEHEFYSTSLGVLTPEDAKLVEEYGQSFEWVKANLPHAMKNELIAKLAERMIFTPYENDAVDIELNGCCNDASLESMLLIAHTDKVRKRQRIIAAKKRFNDHEKK